MTWTITTDRNGQRTYTRPNGQTIAKDGRGSLPWTVHYINEGGDLSLGGNLAGRHGDYGMTDTLGEAKAWANLDAAHTI